MTLDDILTHLRRLAPEEAALEGDPVGLLIAGERADISKIGVCLDCTPDVAARAAGCGAGLVVAHHPLIYRPLARIGSDPVSRAVTALIRADVSLYAMHTNWDRAEGGINDTLAACLELQEVRPLGAEGASALPRIGKLAVPRPLADFARSVDTALGCTGTSALRVGSGEAGGMISRVAVCGGAGAFLVEAVVEAGADAFVTSDVRHNEFWEAEARGLALLDAGHGATEVPGMRALARRLAREWDGVEVVWLDEAAAASA